MRKLYTVDNWIYGPMSGNFLVAAFPSHFSQLPSKRQKYIFPVCVL